MTVITNYYGIRGPVPFEDIDVLADNRLYLDPHAVRLAKGPQPFAKDAVACADSFLDEVTNCVISSDPKDHRRGEGLLQHFEEPWETRLGMSESGFNGHGGAEIVGTWIWDALTGDLDALVRVGVLRQLEDLPLFVDGIDRDITSDVTTRIMYGPLARYTESIIAKFPEFTSGGHKVAKFSRQVWDPSSRKWAKEYFTLPIAAGKPLVLVPKGWARANLLMSAKRFYETSVLSYAQLAQAVVGSNGKLVKTPKDKLKMQSALARGRKTNLRVTLNAIDNQEDLLAYFKSFVASRFDASEENRAA